MAAYTPLKLVLTERGAIPSYLYVKEHVVKKNTSGNDNTAILFVTNLPPYTTRDDVMSWFNDVGDVTEVEVGRLSNQIKEAERICRLNTRFDISTRRSVTDDVGRLYARVSFASRDALHSVMSIAKSNGSIRGSNVSGSHGLNGMDDDDGDDGIAMISQYHVTRSTPKELQKEIATILDAYDEREAEEAKKRQISMNVPDADGFITVQTKTTKYRGPADSIRDPLDVPRKAGRRKKKKADMFLKDFYVFQKREKRREEIAELRQKFENDKKRVADMKQRRKFKPY